MAETEPSSSTPEADASPADPSALPHIVIITGLSGSGKGSALRVFEDMGYYAIDNLPVALLPTFADLCARSSEINRAALVIDIREGESLRELPPAIESLRDRARVQLIFMEAREEILQRRFSETRRPHPLGKGETIIHSLRAEREMLAEIRAMADVAIDTSRFSIHDLRRFVQSRFGDESETPTLLVTLRSFGFKHGLPVDSDLVFDVRFLPNPYYIEECRKKTGLDAPVIEYIRSFPQTNEFIQRVSDLLIHLLPHYAKEGKSYLTVSVGCTGGHHRSVMITEAIAKNLRQAGCDLKVVHRDIER